MPLALPCRNRWCPNLQPCPVHPILAFPGAPMPPGWRSLRAAVLARDGYRCRECGETATDVHHVIRRADGGTDDPANLVSLCRGCHAHHTAVEGGRSAW